MEAAKLQEIQEAIEAAIKNGCRFVSFMYRGKESGETSIYTINLGIMISHAYKDDLELLPSLPARTNAEKEAKAEIIASLTDSLTNGVGNNSRFTQRGLFEHQARGLKLNIDSGELLISGFEMRKEIINPGVEKIIKSSEKTLAKKKFHAMMKCKKFKNFCLTLDTIGGIKMNGEILEIHN